MKQEKKMSVATLIKSFSYAFDGLAHFLKSEPNVRIHAIATVAVIILGIARHIGHWQWAAICFAIALVWITETINTCIERLCDFSCDNQWHPAIKVIKDISAAAVLIAAMTSVVIGVIVFFF